MSKTTDELREEVKQAMTESLSLYEDVRVPPGHIGISVVDRVEAGCTCIVKFKDAMRWMRAAPTINKLSTPELRRQAVAVMFRQYLHHGRNHVDGEALTIGALNYMWHDADKKRRQITRAAIRNTLKRCGAVGVTVVILDGDVAGFFVTEPGDGPAPAAPGSVLH